MNDYEKLGFDSSPLYKAVFAEVSDDEGGRCNYLFVKREDKQHTCHNLTHSLLAIFLYIAATNTPQRMYESSVAANRVCNLFFPVLLMARARPLSRGPVHQIRPQREGVRKEAIETLRRGSTIQQLLSVPVASVGLE